jgi:Ser/Thr protein kinase RdoA (MazF antagonist)
MSTVAQPPHTTAAPRDVLAILLDRGYVPDGEPFTVGRPDRTTIPMLTESGCPVVVKIYSDDGGQACFANMRALWSSSFGQGRNPPGLPRPIEYLVEHRILVLERVAGRALAEMGEPDAAAVQGAVRLAAALHDSDARPGRRRGARGILRSLRRKVERISRLDSALGAELRRVVDLLEGSQRKEPELVPTHGDFSPRNVLVGPDRSVLIDWDRFQLADPARDVAYFGTWCWVDRLRRSDTASWSVLEDALSAYQALRPQGVVADRLDFHVAAGLVRIVEGLVTLWPGDAYLAPIAAEEALSRAKVAAARRAEGAP